MKKLILISAAVAAGVFVWKKKQESDAHKAAWGNATDKVK